MSFQSPITIAQAINRIETNKYLLPAIQREFIWGHDRIEWLFDSIMRDYPVSSFLFWRVEGNTKTAFKFYKFINEYRQYFKTHNEEIQTAGLSDFEAVLDGQQRLTSFYIGLKGSYAYKLKNFQWKNDERNIPTRHLYLDLSSSLNSEDEEDGRKYNFQFLTENEFLNDGSTKKWFKVANILSLGNIADFLNFININDYQSNSFAVESLSKLQHSIHGKTFINYYLETEQDYHKALNIFIRINKGGQALDYSDLIMSITVAGWNDKDARKEIHKLIDNVRDLGFTISKDLILRTYLILHANDIKFRVNNFDDSNAKDFQSKWDNIRESIYSSFKLIKKFGFDDYTLSSKNAVLPIIYWIYSKDRIVDYDSKIAYKDERAIIKKWLHVVLLHGIFGGQAESVLKIIRDTIKDQIELNAELFPASEIAKRLGKTNKSIFVNDDFLENLLETQYEDRYSFSILAILYPNLDFQNGNFNKDHLHPISFFNQSKLKSLNLDTKNEKYWYYNTPEFYNGIVNLQLLDENQNKSKSNKTLSEWITKENIDTEKHIIPEKYIEIENFIEFVDLRWELLKKKLEIALTF